MTFFQTLNHAKVIWDSRSKPKGLLGRHLNIRSIASKIDHVDKLLTDSNLDFICLSETWLTKTSPQAAFNIPGYNIFRRDRETGKGGGLLFYIKDNLQCKQIYVQEKLDMEIECIGDFNVKWTDKNCGKRLKEITGLYSFTKLIKGPTRIYFQINQKIFQFYYRHYRSQFSSYCPKAK